MSSLSCIFDDDDAVTIDVLEKELTGMVAKQCYERARFEYASVDSVMWEATSCSRRISVLFQVVEDGVDLMAKAALCQ